LMGKFAVHLPSLSDSIFDAYDFICMSICVLGRAQEWHPPTVELAAQQFLRQHQ